jgi:hypothetical protein
MMPKEAVWRKADQRIGPGKHLKEYKDRIKSSRKSTELFEKMGCNSEWAAVKSCSAMMRKWQIEGASNAPALAKA